MKDFEKFVMKTVTENQGCRDNFGFVTFPSSSLYGFRDTPQDEYELDEYTLKHGVVTIDMKSLVAFAANFTTIGAMDSALLSGAEEVLTK